MSAGEEAAFVQERVEPGRVPPVQLPDDARVREGAPVGPVGLVPAIRLPEVESFLDFTSHGLGSYARAAGGPA